MSTKYSYRSIEYALVRGTARPDRRDNGLLLAIALSEIAEPDTQSYAISLWARKLCCASGGPGSPDTIPATQIKSMLETGTRHFGPAPQVINDTASQVNAAAYSF